MNRAWRHVRALWPRWMWVPVAPFAVFFLFLGIRGDLRWEHLALAVVAPVLAYGNASTKRLFVAAVPMVYVGVLYQAMGYVKDVGVSPARVLNCELRSFEMRLFGIAVGGERMTLSDYFVTHHATWIDLGAAIPYGTFIFACIAVNVYLFFKDYPAAQRFAWIFFLMNVLGFITYHALPAAPPWYFHQHGCEISMTALPSAGPRLTHVDEVLGVDYFRSMYARSSDLYGALPSLHVAYPLLIVIEGWRAFGKLGRAASILFAATMAFAAVYLDHHWVTDVVLGVCYCLASIALVRWIQARARAAAASTTATSSA